MNRQSAQNEFAAFLRTKFAQGVPEFRIDEAWFDSLFLKLTDGAEWAEREGFDLSWIVRQEPRWFCIRRLENRTCPNK